MAEVGDKKRRLRAAMKKLQWALESESARRINAMLDLARSEPGVAIKPGDLDRDPWLFNCKNGTLELRAGKLREHRREDYLTKLCPVAYHPDAPCPTWEHLLGSVFPDDEDEPDHELIRFVQRSLGRCLTGDVSEQILWIFWGVGANGKSTLLNAIFDTIGSDYCLKAPSDLLMTSRGDRHPTEIASLWGKRLVFASETHQGRRLNEALIKDLTGSEPLTARRMKEDFWTFDPTHKVILTTNHKPRIEGTDEGIWRRIRLVPFTTVFWDPNDPNKNPAQLPSHLRQDKRLGEKLRAEREGILAWLVRGCMDWLRDGLTLPEKVKAATRDFRGEEDTLARWIEECCTTGDESYRCRSQRLYGNYKEWCQRASEEPLSQKYFGPALEERGYPKKTSDGVWYLRIALRET
jgi:putative DNA primase/helicase